MRHVVRTVVVALLLGVGLPAAAQETGHYIWGVEGIRAGTVPPPGLYYRQYNAFYNAQTTTDGNGDVAPIGFGVSVFANVHRLIYISPIKVLGANYGADVIVPIVDTHVGVNAVPMFDSKWGLYDICVEPLILSWHGKWFDAAAGLGAWLPVGDFDVTRPASPGKGFWSGMLSLGGTWYPEKSKLWSLSVLNRTEFHGRNSDKAVTPGLNSGIEWGVARTFPTKSAIVDVGLVGYDQWQFADDTGPGAVLPGTHDSVHALGGELSAFVPSAKAVFSIRSLWEYSAVHRSRGNMTTFTITGIF